MFIMVGVLSGGLFAFQRGLLDLSGCSWYNNLIDKSEFEKENKIEKSYKIDGLSCKGDC